MLGKKFSCKSASEERNDDQCMLKFNQRCLIDPAHTSDIFKLFGCDSKCVLSDDKRGCVSSTISVRGSMSVVILLIFFTAKIS